MNENETEVVVDDDNYDVDLYMNSRSTCLTFGRQDVVAYIIESDNG